MGCVETVPLNYKTAIKKMGDNKVIKVLIQDCYSF